MKTIDDMLGEIARMNGAKQPSVPAPSSQPAGILMKPTLGLALAREITYCIEKAAEQMGVNVVTAVTDSGGKPILLEAMDGSLIASVGAAQDKAYTAVALKMPTHKALEASRGGVFDGLTGGGGILLLAGGYPIEADGNIIGGIGVSGGTKEQDEALARAGTIYVSERLK